MSYTKKKQTNYFLKNENFAVHFILQYSEQRDSCIRENWKIFYSMTTSTNSYNKKCKKE